MNKYYKPRSLPPIFLGNVEKDNEQVDLVERFKHKSELFAKLSEYVKEAEVKVFMDESAPYSGLGDTISLYKPKPEEEPIQKVEYKSTIYPSGVIVDDELWIL